MHDMACVPVPILTEQARQNRTTRNQWQLYGSHRREIEKLIVPESRGGRLCVLGAGNCNDLDLQWLIDAYREVHLVDLDPAALEGAIRRQKVPLVACPPVPKTRVDKPPVAPILLHAPVDLTGVAAEI